MMRFSVDDDTKSFILVIVIIALTAKEDLIASILFLIQKLRNFDAISIISKYDPDNLYHFTFAVLLGLIYWFYLIERPNKPGNESIELESSHDPFIGNLHYENQVLSYSIATYSFFPRNHPSVMNTPINQLGRKGEFKGSEFINDFKEELEELFEFVREHPEVKLVMLISPKPGTVLLRLSVILYSSFVTTFDHGTNASRSSSYISNKFAAINKLSFNRKEVNLVKVRNKKMKMKDLFKISINGDLIPNLDFLGSQSPSKLELGVFDVNPLLNILENMRPRNVSDMISGNHMIGKNFHGYPIMINKPHNGLLMGSSAQLLKIMYTKSSERKIIFTDSYSSISGLSTNCKIVKSSELSIPILKLSAENPPFFGLLLKLWEKIIASDKQVGYQFKTLHQDVYQVFIEKLIHEPVAMKETLNLEHFLSEKMYDQNLDIYQDVVSRFGDIFGLAMFNGVLTEKKSLIGPFICHKEISSPENLVIDVSEDSADKKIAILILILALKYQGYLDEVVCLSLNNRINSLELKIQLIWQYLDFKEVFLHFTSIGSVLDWIYLLDVVLCDQTIENPRILQNLNFENVAPENGILMNFENRIQTVLKADSISL